MKSEIKFDNDRRMEFCKKNGGFPTETYNARIRYNMSGAIKELEIQAKKYDARTNLVQSLTVNMECHHASVQKKFDGLFRELFGEIVNLYETVEKTASPDGRVKTCTDREGTEITTAFRKSINKLLSMKFNGIENDTYGLGWYDDTSNTGTQFSLNWEEKDKNPISMPHYGHRWYMVIDKTMIDKIGDPLEKMKMGDFLKSAGTFRFRDKDLEPYTRNTPGVMNSDRHIAQLSDVFKVKTHGIGKNRISELEMKQPKPHRKEQYYGRYM